MRHRANLTAMRILAVAAATHASACAPAPVPVAAPAVETPPAAARHDSLAQDRPFVVVMHADWCAACRRSAPAVAWLREEYGDRVTFLDLDVTDDAARAQSAQAAAEVGLGPFFDKNRDLPGVTILGRDRRTVRHFAAEYRSAPYRTAVDEALETFQAHPH